MIYFCAEGIFCERVTLLLYNENAVVCAIYTHIYINICKDRKDIKYITWCLLEIFIFLPLSCNAAFNLTSHKVKMMCTRLFFFSRQNRDAFSRAWKNCVHCWFPLETLYLPCGHNTKYFYNILISNTLLPHRNRPCMCALWLYLRSQDSCHSVDPCNLR